MSSDTDLASLVASRLCHDVVGPVGAIQNGLELMAEEGEASEMAMDLIQKSAAQASAKLQFARMAYGAAGGATELDPAEAGRLTAGIFAGERATLDWTWAGEADARDRVKIAMLMAAYALGAVPRGGTITVRREAAGVVVEAKGAHVRAPPFLESMTEGSEVADPRAVPPMVILQLARRMGWSVTVTAGESTMTFKAAGA